MTVGADSDSVEMGRRARPQAESGRDRHGKRARGFPWFYFSSRIKLNTFRRIVSSTGQALCLKIIILNIRNSLLFSSPSP